MRRTLALGALAGLAVLALAQGSGSALLANLSKAINGAQSLSAAYTFQVIGGAPFNYTVELKKPNLVRIDKPNELIVADGKTVVTYDKQANTYFKQPQTEDFLKATFSNDELSVWSGFFDANAYKAITSKALGTKNRKGMNLSAVEATVDPQGRKVVTYYLAPDNAPRQAEIVLKNPDGTMAYVLNATSVNLNSDVASDRFAFAPPAGSRELTEEELNSDKWYTDLEEGLQVAAKTKRLALVDFYTDW